MIVGPTTYPTFYNQTVDHYKYNIWHSLQVNIIVGIAAIILILFICISLIEIFLSWREHIIPYLEPELNTDPITDPITNPITKHNIIV